MLKFVNNIVCGDCTELLSQVKKPFADLIFADPPFNIGYKYDKYNDKVKKDCYLEWTKDWMAACKNVLKPTGSFYIAIGDKYAANIKVIADELGLIMRNWIIWHYTFGQQMKNKFACSHTHIFYFVKDKKNFTFNDHTVRVPSNRQLIYNDKRANPAGKMPDDVWTEFSRVCGTFKERTGWHPCQMPEDLLARIIMASSNPGDCVLDPFIGSGTTAATALKNGREYAGIDISEDYVANTNKRLDQIKEEQKELNINHFDAIELNEIKRLLRDFNMPAKEISGSNKLMPLFAGQLAVRMNNKKHYNPETIKIAFKNLML